MRYIITITFYTLLLSACGNRESEPREVAVAPTESGYRLTLSKEITDKLPPDGMDVEFALIYGDKETSIRGRAYADNTQLATMVINTDQVLKSMCQDKTMQDKNILCNERFRLQGIGPDGPLSVTCGNCYGPPEHPDGLQYSPSPIGCYCIEIHEE